MKIVPYDRNTAVAYARKWALGRNPIYYDFEKIGGDCTNFASQCLFAGSGIMNKSKSSGWYYHSAADRSPSWAGVEFLYEFLTRNRSVGPFARTVSAWEAEPGDLVQLGDHTGHFYHCPVIVAVKPDILVAAHSINALERRLDSYRSADIRFLHIEGVRIW